MAYCDQSECIRESGFREINISISEWLTINFYERIKKSETGVLLHANGNCSSLKIQYGSELCEIIVNFVHSS